MIGIEALKAARFTWFMLGRNTRFLHSSTTKPNPADRYDPDNGLVVGPLQLVGSRPILLSLIEST